jgi:hypothetical protein
MLSFVTSPEEPAHATTVAGRPFTIPRRLRRNRLVGRWVAAWLGGHDIGGGQRRSPPAGVCRPRRGARRPPDLHGHAAGALTYYIWLLDQRWPVPTTLTAIPIGGSWAALTVLFEFGGRYVLGSSWSELFANYNLAAGRIWVLVPVWMALEPAVLQRLRAIRS